MKRVFLVLMLVLGINVFAGYGATEFSKKVQTFEETGKVMNYSSDEYPVSTDGKYRVIGVVIEEFDEAVGLNYFVFIVQNTKTGRCHIYELDDDEELDRYVYNGYFEVDYSRLLEAESSDYTVEIIKDEFRRGGKALLTRYEIKRLIDKYGL